MGGVELGCVGGCLEFEVLLAGGWVVVGGMRFD